jgi:hypothetical protein
MGSLFPIWKGPILGSSFMGKGEISAQGREESSAGGPSEGEKTECEEDAGRKGRREGLERDLKKRGKIGKKGIPQNEK